ncbi:ion-transporting P-type ATPase [Blattamonas nauphoetae]|uniref:Ion-transporting P-type ATPase n=1 Tax=Blattamonas nauphoetae TaxID=2049346 RepID=A0ABQ9YG33_9EUKA|nr:ion-transporting P-type ATPase [Blattamonas nauphoetae]
MIVCYVMQQWTEGIVIFIVVIINPIIGFVQEYKADKASEAYPKFVCIHDVDTALGDRSNMLFSSTYVAKGTGTAICVETGVRTEIGKISSMVANVKQEKTPLTRQMTQFGHNLVIITLVLIVVAFLCVKFVHYQEISWGGAFLYRASIGVAVVPEGLHAIVSLTLAIGMQRMVKQKALIRSMPAVETTGAVSVICSHKTGTLTTNQMTARSILTFPQKFQVSGTGYDPVDGEVIPVETAITLNDPVPDPNDAYTLTIQSGTEAGKKLLEQQMQFEQWKKDNAEYMPLQGFDVNAKPDVVNNPRKSLDPRLQKTSVLTSQLLRCGVLCNDSVIVRNQEDRLAVQGDTTEGSLFPLPVKIGMNTNEATRKNKRMHVIPFESDYGFMATANDCPVTDYSSTEEKASGDKTNHMIFLKGAPEKVFNLCKFQANVNDEGEVVVEEMDKQFWLDETEKIAAVGLRTLGLAHRYIPKDRFGEQIVETEKCRHDEIDGEKTVAAEEPKLKKGAPLNFEDITEDFIMLGVVGIFDPPRKESKRAIRKCRRARIKVVMITGDHAKTAGAIGALLGLNPTTGKTSVDLKEMSDETLKEICETTEIYARATPADKLRIVQALQSNGHIVAMTGDGVNDAPALKQAHAGIAMGINGTEVAKEASKLVLLDDNFATIVKAVEEGRKVYDSLKRSITYILPTNMAEGMSLFIAAFISWVPPITPFQILWINSITSVALSSLIPFQRGEHNVLNRHPRDTKKMLLTSTILIRTVYIGLFITFLLNSVYLKDSSVTPRVFRDVGVPSLVSIVIPIGLQFILTYIPGLNTVFGMGPMNWWQWFICLGAAIVIFILAEIEKAIRRCAHKQSAKRKALKLGQRWTALDN